MFSSGLANNVWVGLFYNKKVKKQITNLVEAEKFFELYAPLRASGHYSLDRIRELMYRLGNPQNEVAVIHVAGTSGKTSTAYFIRAVLQKAGKKTGLTVSPHISSIAERAQINGANLPDKIYLHHINKFKKLIEKYPDIQPTYFELVIAFAYWLFAKEKVDYAVIETGLGGLYDATNIVERADKVCVITPIGYDHTEVLGETLQEIATQKAGIIQPNNHVVLSAQNEALMSVFSEVAARKNAEIHPQELSSIPAFLPNFQIGNWQLAYTTYNLLRTRTDKLPVLSKEQLDECARKAPPGRYEIYHVRGKIIILDGAHNQQKLQGLLTSLPRQFQTGNTWVVALVGNDTARIAQSAALLRTIPVEFICTEFSTGQDIKARQSIPAKELAELLPAAHARVERDVQKALEMALASTHDYIVITGSLYLISQIRPLLTQM